MITPHSETLRTFIADDEEPARERLLQLLRREPDIEVLGIATDGVEAVASIRRLEPDLLFLDVRMPELNGFEVLRSLDPAARLATVFVTSFDRYAVQAFEVNGIDYLLKPFSDQRFEAALDRARNLIRNRTGVEMKPARLDYLERIAVRHGRKIKFLNVSDIDWVEAAGVYVYLHSGDREFILRAAISHIAKQLDPKKFTRVNRSAIVRTDQVSELHPVGEGRSYLIRLKNGAEIPLSRGYQARLKTWFHHLASGTFSDHWGQSFERPTGIPTASSTRRIPG